MHIGPGYNSAAKVAAANIGAVALYGELPLARLCFDLRTA